MEYTKPFLTYDQQADRLIEDRGLIADKADLIRHLKDVGYYRLSGYWHIYKKPGSDEFWKGTTFQRVWDAYVFDRQFRLIVFDAIERVEVYMRTQLAYELAAATTPFGYLKSENLPRLNDQQYAHFIDKCNKAYNRAKKGEPFAKHFQEKYGDVHELPPYWILANVMDFGMVVTLYKGAPVSVRKKIANCLNVSAKVLNSWLVTINTVRNICAHQGRLWNRVLGNPPMIPKAEIWHKPYEVANDKVFGTLTVLSYLLERIAPNTSWRKRLFEKIEELTSRNQERMGFTAGWKECPIWKPWVESAN